eukprot:m.177580 g.177580  ORF g.177580 m.177580 type:complete len:232 (-) comp16574_c0_seq3:1871-2566(-)
MSRVLSTLTARVCTFSARSTTLLNSAGKRALCTAPLMGGGYPSLSLSGIRSTSSAKEASSLSSSLRQLTTTTAMAATKLEEKLKTLITGIYDGTSEADGPPLETVCLNVSKQLEDVGNDTKAVVRMYFHGPTVRNDGQGMNMEEKFDVIPFGEFPLELVTRSLQYMGEDSSSSEEQVSNRIAKTVEILRDASLDGQAFKYIITSDMYDYGLVTVTKDKYILGWCAKGVVWT